MVQQIKTKFHTTLVLKISMLDLNQITNQNSNYTESNINSKYSYSKGAN